MLLGTASLLTTPTGVSISLRPIALVIFTAYLGYVVIVGILYYCPTRARQDAAFGLASERMCTTSCFHFFAEYPGKPTLLSTLPDEYRYALTGASFYILLVR